MKKLKKFLGEKDDKYVLIMGKEKLLKCDKFIRNIFKGKKITYLEESLFGVDNNGNVFYSNKNGNLIWAKDKKRCKTSHYSKITCPEMSHFHLKKEIDVRKITKQNLYISSISYDKIKK